MLRTIVSIIIFALIGFVVAYLIFARVGDGDYISLEALFIDKNALRDFVLQFGGIDLDAIRTKIYISTGVGAVVGALVGASRRRK